jgi:thiol:disulfide interchange protein
MSRGALEVRTENSEGGTVLERVAHGHAIAVCQIVETATRVVKWSVVKRNPSVELPFEQNSSQQQISAEQAGCSARGVCYLQATAELERLNQDRPSYTARPEPVLIAAEREQFQAGWGQQVRHGLAADDRMLEI